MGITKRFNGTQLEQELTKPCPLMPDGEWVAVEFQFAQTADKKFVKYKPIAGFSETYRNNLFDGNFINLNSFDEWVETSSEPNATWRLTLNANYKYLECRMSIVPAPNARWASAIHVQNSYGWEISAVRRQSYIICSDQGLFIRNTNTTTSATEKELICTFRVYCYIAKIMDDEKYI